MKELRFRASPPASTQLTQWEELKRLFVEARCAVSNTADRGYETDPDDRPDAGRPDLSGQAREALLARHRAGAKPITLFPCELTPGNGQVLRGVVLDVLDRWQTPATSRRWIGDECVWVNSLVDRIVSEPLEPLGAVAEPMRCGRSRTSPGLSCPAGTPPSW